MVSTRILAKIQRKVTHGSITHPHANTYPSEHLLLPSLDLRRLILSFNCTKPFSLPSCISWALGTQTRRATTNWRIVVWMLCARRADGLGHVRALRGLCMVV
jgi:hypothetical protein